MLGFIQYLNENSLGTFTYRKQQIRKGFKKKPRVLKKDVNVVHTFTKDTTKLLKGLSKQNIHTFKPVKEEKKSKCPHCGSHEYGLMPTDFETAKCSKCGKNWQINEDLPKPPHGQKYLRIKDVIEYGRKSKKEDFDSREPRVWQYPVGEDYGDPAIFRTTPKTFESTNTPDLQVTRDGVMQERKKTVKKEDQTPDETPYNDYGPGSTPSYARMSEGFVDPYSHPFHATATSKGFKHIGSSSALGAATHRYSHNKSGEELQLKTNSGGAPSWKHGSIQGTDKSSLIGHTIRTGLDENKNNATEHPLHKVLSRLGYEHASTHIETGMPTKHLFVHDDKHLPTVTLHSTDDNHGFTVHSTQDIHGKGHGELGKAIAGHFMRDEGFLDFLKTPKVTTPIVKDSPHYKTNHSYSAGSEIEPKTVPVFKPQYDYSAKKTETKKF